MVSVDCMVDGVWHFASWVLKMEYDYAESIAGFGCIICSRHRLFLITLLPIRFWISAFTKIYDYRLDPSIYIRSH